jgi:aspartyl-tRNA(Asn)/glutamyl-tRNA(Gln) amidotransferase subunit C
MSKNIVTTAQVKHIAHLATIPVAETEAEKLAVGFGETLDVVDQLRTLDTSSTPITYQVTGLKNIWRDDVVVPEHSFSQQQALANAAQTHQGYFVVPGLLKNKDS